MWNVAVSEQGGDLAGFRVILAGPLAGQVLKAPHGGAGSTTRSWFPVLINPRDRSGRLSQVCIRHTQQLGSQEDAQRVMQYRHCNPLKIVDKSSHDHAH